MADAQRDAVQAAQGDAAQAGQQVLRQQVAAVAALPVVHRGGQEELP
jgi:hypothetical protein